ncbi:histidine kinase, partial [Kitasatospora purpeofusca]
MDPRPGGSDAHRPAGPRAGPGARGTGRSFAREIFLLQLVMVVLLVVGAVAALVVQQQRSTTTDARHRTLAAAESFAHAPGLVAALDGPDPTTTLQPLAEEVRTAAGIDALIVYRLDGTVLTHSDTSQIGKHLIGPYAEAAEGKAFTRTFNGALGRSVVSAVPVEDATGAVVAIVAAPVTLESIHKSVHHELPVFLIGAVAASALAAGCAALVSRRLRRQTRGLGPATMTRMYEHHDAVLHAVREGVLITDDTGRLLLANDEARRLLDLPADAEGRHVDTLGLAPGTAELLASDRTADDEVHRAGDRLLSLNKRPTSPTGEHGTSVVTLRDTTELRALAGRAELARSRLRLLYDAGMRIGSTLNVVRTAEELAQAAVPGFADIATVELQDPVLHGDAPAGASTVLRRSAVAGLAQDHPLYPVGKLIDFVPGTPMAASVREGRAVVGGAHPAAHGGGRPGHPSPEHKRDPARHNQLVGPHQGP